MAIFNTHTHVFNVPCVPDAFITNYGFPSVLGKIARPLVKQAMVRKTILAILKKIPIGGADSRFKRYLALLDVALHKYQVEVFETLQQHHDSQTRFVLLTMNFDYMTGRPPAENYNRFSTQIHEALDVRKRYPQLALPFLSIDPREGKDECLRLLRYHFDPTNKRGMVGIKLYPSLGYYPFYPNLEPVYQFAETHQIPIITHAYKDGGAYYTGQFTPEVMSYNSFHPTAISKRFLNEALSPFPYKKQARHYANIMMHPVLYHDVLEKFPNLKICFAHFGGHEEIVTMSSTHPSNGPNWTHTILELMRMYPQVYTDISYSLAYTQSNQIILQHMRDDTRFANRVLFGTDFFLTETKMKERQLLEKFKIEYDEWVYSLMDTNPSAFLSSSFYTP